MIFIMLTSSMIIIFITTIIMSISSFMSKKTFTDREKSSPFECGFDPKGTARIPFSLRFFLIAIIFLIFDVEITLLLPMSIIYETSNPNVWMMISMIFIIILIMGLYHEWNQGMLNWAE
uniref:NADH-ubiquinone oxidoreductase chain 3 n=1 Tax=Petrobiellus sp. 2 JZ-2014 TaxID=1529459 RepID=A0A0B4N638_9INSE|nr:NADH dehydrogenase subunit 3 [Petrobiellus sp. 2 JZ-2014]